MDCAYRGDYTIGTRGTQLPIKGSFVAALFLTLLAAPLSAQLFVPSVTIDSAARGSSVYVDGQLRGQTPLQLRLRPGTYQVRIEAPGGRSAGEHEIRVTNVGRQRFVLAAEGTAPAASAPRASQPQPPPRQTRPRHTSPRPQRTRPAQGTPPAAEQRPAAQPEPAPPPARSRATTRGPSGRTRADSPPTSEPAPETASPPRQATPPPARGSDNQPPARERPAGERPAGDGNRSPSAGARPAPAPGRQADGASPPPRPSDTGAATQPEPPATGRDGRADDAGGAAAGPRANDDDNGNQGRGNDRDTGPGSEQRSDRGRSDDDDDDGGSNEAGRGRGSDQPTDEAPRDSQPAAAGTATIDVRPGNSQNRVNLRSQGNLPVALLSSQGFDAATVDLESLRIGDGTGTAVGASRRGNGTLHVTVRDVDRDGRDDLVVQFDIGELTDAGAVSGDSTRLVLTGATPGGASFAAEGEISVTGGR